MKQILDHADLLIMAPCCLGYLWAADRFCKKFLGASKKKELLFVMASFCGGLFLSVVNRQYPVPYIVSMLLGHIFFMGLVLLLFQANRNKKILAASMVMAVRTLAGNFCESFLSGLLLFLRHTVKKIPEPFLNEWEIRLSVAVSFCVVTGTVFLISKYLESVFCGKPGRWYITLAVPLLMTVAVIDVVNWGAANGIMVKSGADMGLHYDQIFSHAGICVLTGLSMSAMGFYVFGMSRIYLEQEKSGRYHSQIAVYKMLEEQYKQSERLRHDMKNHIIVLSGLFQNKEWEKLGDYLKKMEGSGLKLREDVTGNRVVDALLYRKRERAEKENVKWECDVQIPKDCCIHEFDLCVLFGNILDNALEACERLQCDPCGFINIRAKTVKKCFLIEVKNSMDPAERYGDGSLNKKNPKEHGIGLLNVGDVVNRYNGVMNAEAQNDIFVISMLFPSEPEKDTAYDIRQTI